MSQNFGNVEAASLMVGGVAGYYSQQQYAGLVQWVIILGLSGYGMATLSAEQKEKAFLLFLGGLAAGYVLSGM